MTIVKGSSEAEEAAESDKAAGSLGSEKMSPESPEGEVLPRIQQINEQIKQKSKRLNDSATTKPKTK